MFECEAEVWNRVIYANLIFLLAWLVSLGCRDNRIDVFRFITFLWLTMKMSGALMQSEYLL